MQEIEDLLKKNRIQRANINYIKTAIELAKYQQSNFESLDDAVKRIAYHLTLTIYPDIDEYWKKIAEIEKSKKKQKEINKRANTPSIKYESESEETPVLVPLTPKQKQLITDFKRVVIDYLQSLPCFTTHLSIDDQKQVKTDFEYWMNNHRGTPDLHLLSERRNLLNVQYIGAYLINNFNVIKVQNGGVTNLAYWNGETYLTGEKEIDGLIKKVNLLTYNNLYSKDCRKPVNTKDVCEYLEIMADTKDIAPASYIPCLNGILKIDIQDPDNLKLLPFNPDIITIYQYQGYYKPVSEIPQAVRDKVNRYFELIANKDKETTQHYEEIKDRIFEYCSTVLYRGQQFKSYGFLHGASDAGKSSFLKNCIFSILPKIKKDKDESNFSVVKLNQLDNRFELSGLEGQFANLFDEFNLSYGAKGETQQEALKSLVSGLKIRVENKNVKAHDIIVNARLFVALNYYMNITDEATAKKMVYIPMRGTLNTAYASQFYIDENSSQDEKDFIFMTLLGYLQQIFKNYVQTGKYFSQSKYIDDLQITAETTTNELLNRLQDWLEKKEPFKDYPIGQLMNKSNFIQMRLSYYENLFNEYLCEINKKIKVTAEAFKYKLLKLIGNKYIYVDNATDPDFRASGVRGVLLPKIYKGQKISRYKDYRELILLEQKTRAETNNIIDLNTDKKAKEIQDQHLTNPICK